jgi:uncharacterized protein (DUF1684 family)
MKPFAITLLCTVIMVTGCSHAPVLPPLSSADSLSIVEDNIAHRVYMDRFFRSDPGSPFRRDTTISYHGIKWYPVDPHFRGVSMLHRYADPETVNVMGTRGETRRQLRYGYFEFVVPGEKGTPTLLKLNVYKFTPYDGQRYVLYRDNLSVWFTDRTTGEETYNVGRYVEIGNEDPDPSHSYAIDLNKAFNPYCAYSAMYSCAIPRQEDHVALALRVGEMKYHK